MTIQFKDILRENKLSTNERVASNELLSVSSYLASKNKSQESLKFSKFSMNPTKYKKEINKELDVYKNDKIVYNKINQALKYLK